MGSYSGDGVGSVMTFVNPSFYTPNADSSLQPTGNFFATLNVSGNATIKNLKVTELLTVKDIVVEGKITIKGDIHLSGTINQDQNAITRSFKASQDIQKGSVVVLDPEHDSYVMLATKAQDTRVIGVAVTAAAAGEEITIATGGTAQVRVAQNTHIETGDLLVSDSSAGYAIANGEPKAGAVLGKATSNLISQEGMIWLLITLN
jgi:predicted RecA/RadA family phage recombinase